MVYSKRKIELIILMIYAMCFNTMFIIPHTHGQYVQLTYNVYTDSYPEIHNGMVTWMGSDGYDYEIYLYDGSFTIQLTDNDYYDRVPEIHNGIVIWEGFDGYDYEIYLYDGSSTIQLTDNDYDDRYPNVHNGVVVWYGYDGYDYEIYLYDGSSTIQLTDNDYDDDDPDIHDGMVAWHGYDGHDWEIFLADLSYNSGKLIWKKVSDPSSGDDIARSTAVDGSGVYIVGYDSRGGDWRWRMEKRSLTTGIEAWTKTTNPSSEDDYANDVAVDGTGVYIVGCDKKGGDWRWRIEKRNLVDGSVIWKRVGDPSSSADEAHGVAIDGTGVYVVGYDRVGEDARWRIEKRSLTTGGLIWTRVGDPSSGNDRAYNVAVDGSGVYVVGYDEVGGDRRWRIEKRNPEDGSLIWYKTANPSSSNDEAYDVAVDETGVYVVGYDRRGGDRRWRMEKRSLADGSLIWKRVGDPSSGDDEARSVAVGESGVYVVGYDEVGGDRRWRIEKRDLGTGLLIWKRVGDPSSNDDKAYGVAVEGFMYLVGYDERGGDARWRMEKRYP